MKPKTKKNGFDVAWGRVVLEEANERGVLAPSLSRWFATEGDSAAHVDVGVVNQAWARMLAHAPRPLEPVLAVNNRLRAQDLGPLGIAMITAPNLRAMIGLSQRYLPLMSDVLQVDYVAESDIILARLRNHPDAFWPNQLLFILHRMRLGEQLLRRQPLIEALLLNFADRGLERELNALVAAPVIFGAAYTGAVISGDVLDRDAPGSQPEVHRAMVDLLEEQLEKTGGRTFLQACDVVRDFLDLGMPIRATSVAARLHVSTRTLQRRLQDEGWSFAEVVRYKRLRMAQRMLLTTNASVQAIADRTGFANQHGFSRFFQASMGMSPTRYRTQQGANISASEVVGMVRRELTR